MIDTSGISPCFALHYQYDGPNPSHDTSPFTIHCTLGKGAEAYYSGIRVVIFAKKTGYGDDFAKAEVQIRRPAGRRKMIAGKLVTIDPPVPDINGLFNDGLPLCTLIFELVDLSSGTWSAAEIKFARTETSTTRPVQIPDTHRVLYEYVKRTTVDSPSCFLLLATRYAGLRYRLKPNNSSGITCTVDPARMGPPTHGFQVLPPNNERPLFAQPPPEILYTIFSILARDSGHNNNWRKGLVSMSLVCRAWTNTALCVAYEDFSRSSSRPDIARLAMALEDNPMWGMHIKRFSPYCFANGGTAVRLQESALTILKTALNMRRLLVFDVNTMLVGEFVETFCKMTELRDFTQLFNGTSVADDGTPAKTYLNAAQLTRCFSHWRKLRWAAACKFGQPLSAEDSLFAPARCALEQIRFKHGTVSMAQLRAMTAASQDTLHTVVLKSIRGISNKELASWLIDFGANLESLELESNVFTRSEAEELAGDAAIHNMPKLCNLKIEGAVATVLTLLRFEPVFDAQSKDRARRYIQIRDPMLFDPHAFVIALRMTKWENVEITGLRMSEAKRVANERGIYLWMRT